MSSQKGEFRKSDVAQQNSPQVGEPSPALATNAKGKFNQKKNTGNKPGSQSNLNPKEEDKNNGIKGAIRSTASRQGINGHNSSSADNKDGSEIQSAESNAGYFPTRTSSAPPDEHSGGFGGSRKGSSGFKPTKTNRPLSEETNHHSAGGQPSNNFPHSEHVIDKKELTVSYAHAAKSSLPKEPPPPPPPPPQITTTLEVATNATTPTPPLVDPIPQASTINLPQSSEINIPVTTSSNNGKNYGNIARSINNARSQHGATNNNNRVNNPPFNSNGQHSVHSQPLGGAMQHQHLQTPQLTQNTQQASQHLSNQPIRDGPLSSRNNSSYNNNNRGNYQNQSNSNYRPNQQQMGGPRGVATLPTQQHPPQGAIVMQNMYSQQQQHAMPQQIYHSAGFPVNSQGMMIPPGQPGGPQMTMGPGGYPQQSFHNQDVLHSQMTMQQQQPHPQFLQQQIPGFPNQQIMYPSGIPMTAQQFQIPLQQQQQQQQYMHHNQGAMPHPDMMQQQGGPRTQMLTPQQMHTQMQQQQLIHQQQMQMHQPQQHQQHPHMHQQPHQQMIQQQQHMQQQHIQQQQQQQQQQQPLLPQHQAQLPSIIPQPQHQHQQQQPLQQHQKVESQTVSNQNYSSPAYLPHPSTPTTSASLTAVAPPEEQPLPSASSLPLPSSTSSTPTTAPVRSKVVVKTKGGQIVNLHELAAKPSTATTSLVPSANAKTLPPPPPPSSYKKDVPLASSKITSKVEGADEEVSKKIEVVSHDVKESPPSSTVPEKELVAAVASPSVTETGNDDQLIDSTSLVVDAIAMPEVSIDGGRIPAVATLESISSNPIHGSPSPVLSTISSTEATSIAASSTIVSEEFPSKVSVLPSVQQSEQLITTTTDAIIDTNLVVASEKGMTKESDKIITSSINNEDVISTLTSNGDGNGAIVENFTTQKQQIEDKTITTTEFSITVSETTTAATTTSQPIVKENTSISEKTSVSTTVLDDSSSDNLTSESQQLEQVEGQDQVTLTEEPEADWEGIVTDLVPTTDGSEIKSTEKDKNSNLLYVAPANAIANTSSSTSGNQRKKATTKYKDFELRSHDSLDAYTTTNNVVPPKNPPVVPTPTTPIPTTTITFQPKPINASEAPWGDSGGSSSSGEKSGLTVNEAPKSSVQRSLRPTTSKKLNEGPKGSSNTGSSRLIYSRDELYKLRPAFPEKPGGDFPNYTSVVCFGPDGQRLRVQGGVPSKQTGDQKWSKQGPPMPPAVASPPIYPDRSGNMDFGAAGGGWGRVPQPPLPMAGGLPMQMINGVPQMMGGFNQGPGGNMGLPPFRGKQKQLPAGPMPKKVITDPLEILSRDVQAILNKITPQTFDKLTAQLCEIPVDTNAMLDKLIELVFEKAIQEPNFSNLYAEMCSKLESQSRYWAFLQVFFHRDKNQHMWMVDLTFDKELAGPYGTSKECIAAATAQIPAPVQPVSTEVKVFEVVVSNGILVKIFKAVDQEEYFMSCMPYSNVDPSKLSEKAFNSAEAAEKNALNINSFRRRLLQICQEEFSQSVENKGRNQELIELQSKLDSNITNMSEEDRINEEAKIEDLRMKAKRRMLGNMRFIGELCKNNLLKPAIMFDCIESIMGKEGDWKSMKEEDIELLCKLMHTVGATIEMKCVKLKRQADWESFFERILQIINDRSLNSRMRFNLQEVLSLRKNAWQARREQEGPATLDAIHQKVAQEEHQRKVSGASQPQFQSQKQRVAGGGYPSQDSRQMTSGGNVGANTSSSSSSSMNRSGSSQSFNPQPSTTTSRGGGGGNPMNRTNSVGPGLPIPIADRRSDYPPVSSDFRRTSSEPQQHQQPQSQPQSQQYFHRRENSEEYTSQEINQDNSQQQQPTTSISFDVSSIDEAFSKEAIDNAISKLLRSSNTGEALQVFCKILAMDSGDVFPLLLIPPITISTVISCMIKKYMNSTRPLDKELLLAFLELFLPCFQNAIEVVEDTIGKSEELTFLPDLILDVKTAPEGLGKIFVALVKGSACRKDFLLNRISECKTEFLNGGMTDDDVSSGASNSIEDTFARLITAIDSGLLT